MSFILRPCVTSLSIRRASNRKGCSEEKCRLVGRPQTLLLTSELYELLLEHAEACRHAGQVMNNCKEDREQE